MQHVFCKNLAVRKKFLRSNSDYRSASRARSRASTTRFCAVARQLNTARSSCRPKADRSVAPQRRTRQKSHRSCGAERPDTRAPKMRDARAAAALRPPRQCSKIVGHARLPCARPQMDRIEPVPRARHWNYRHFSRCSQFRQPVVHGLGPHSRRRQCQLAAREKQSAKESKSRFAERRQNSPAASSVTIVVAPASRKPIEDIAQPIRAIFPAPLHTTNRCRRRSRAPSLAAADALVNLAKCAGKNSGNFSSEDDRILPK